MKKENLKKKLDPLQYKVLVEKGTEPAGTGKYLKNKEEGVYLCAACGNELFSSDSKFDSKSGWPSFYSPKEIDSVEMKLDFKRILPRKEVRCSKCGGHLGHVFKDGPQPTGKRYCVNSAALDFKGRGKPKKVKT